MKWHARMFGTVALLAGLLALVISEDSYAADKKKLQAAILKIAALIEKGDDDDLKKEVKALADKVGDKKEFSLEDVMEAFKPRNKNGFGVGEKPGTVMPDGIEQMIINLEKAKKPIVEKNDKELMQLSYISAAIAEIIVDKCPVKKKVKNKDPEEWKQWSAEMRKYSAELAAAAKMKDVKKVQESARKLNNSCGSCHVPFKPE